MSQTLQKLLSEFEFDHIGVAVESIDKAMPFYRAAGFPEPHIEVVAGEKVRTGTLWLRNTSSIELLEPTSDDSAVAKFMQKRGPGIHHICLRVKNLLAIVDRLKAEKIRLINERPMPGANNCLFVFVHPHSTGGVLIELSEKVAK